MRTGFASPLGRLAVCLLAVVLCVTLSLPAQAITANHSFTSASAVAEKTAYTGILVVVVEPCTGLFAQNDPVDMDDPSGLDPQGHHYVPRALWRNLSDRVKNVWDAAKNRLDAKNYKLHNGKPYNKVTRDEYSRAVKDKLDEFLRGKGKTSPEQLSDEELQDFADDIKATDSGPIAEYNEGVAEEILETTEAGAEAVETVEALDVAIEIDEVAVTIGITIE